MAKNNIIDYSKLNFEELFEDDVIFLSCLTKIESNFKIFQSEYENTERNDYFQKNEYLQTCSDLIKAKTKTNTKSRHEYYILDKFNIIDLFARKVLINKSNFIFLNPFY